MYIVPEKLISELISLKTSYSAVEDVFSAMAKKKAYNFPVIRESIGYSNALYGFKSGFDKESLSLGLKAGGYWPENESMGIPNHQSTIFLFDANTGKIFAIVGGNLLTAFRTAAASSISINHLARQDSKVLGMIGLGKSPGACIFDNGSMLVCVEEERFIREKVAKNRWPFHAIKHCLDSTGLTLDAIDKIAGWLWYNKRNMDDLILYTTGRLTSEMIIKTVQMNIPVLISRSGFTAAGVELAKKSNLTLIGRAKGKRFVALAGLERIIYD